MDSCVFCLPAPIAGKPESIWIGPRERNHGENYFDFILFGILKVKDIFSDHTWCHPAYQEGKQTWNSILIMYK